jgi:hypothetical protein
MKRAPILRIFAVAAVLTGVAAPASASAAHAQREASQRSLLQPLVQASEARPAGEAAPAASENLVCVFRVSNPREGARESPEPVVNAAGTATCKFQGSPLPLEEIEQEVQLLRNGDVVAESGPVVNFDEAKSKVDVSAPCESGNYIATMRYFAPTPPPFEGAPFENFLETEKFKIKC